MNEGLCLDISTQRNQLRSLYPNTFANVESREDQNSSKRKSETSPAQEQEYRQSVSNQYHSDPKLSAIFPAGDHFRDGVRIMCRVRRRQLDGESHKVNN